MNEKDLEIQNLRKKLEWKDMVIELAQRNAVVWVSVKDRLPKQFISVLGCIEAAAPFPTVRECYLTGNDGCLGFYIPALNGFAKITHWAEMPKPPKESDANGSGKNKEETSE